MATAPGSNTVKCRIILQAPTPGVNFGLQKGSGNNYETILVQSAAGADLHFNFELGCKTDKEGNLRLHGPFVQGPKGDEFIYIDIGTLAGQQLSPWSRRLKIPIHVISQAMLQELEAKPASVLKTEVAGTAKDGSPNCATVKPFAGWTIAPA